jgi:hypothetical protein
MSFSSPLWLLLLGLLPVIVILHAIAVRWRSVPVSSLVFWDDILRERRMNMRVRRILRNLSLLLELLAAAALALALAGPRITRTGLGGAGDTILVLDGTASMQTREGSRTRFELARAKAQDVLAGLRRGARMALVAAERSPRLVLPFTDDRTALRRAIDSAVVTDEPGDITDTMVFAVSLRDARRGDQVVLITDGAFESLGGVDPSLPWMHVFLTGSAHENSGITAMSFRRSIGGEASYEIFLSLVNTGRKPSSFPLTVSAGKQVVISRAVSLPAGAVTSIALPWNGPTTGRIEARIQPGDDFPADDRAYAVFAPARPLRALVVGPSTFFLERALASLPGVTVRAVAALPSITAAAPAGTAPGSLAQSGAAPGSDATPAPPDDVVVYDGVEPPLLDKGAAILFSTVPANLPLRSTGSLPLPPVTGWSRTDPLLDSVALSGVAIGQALALEPGPGFSILATTNGWPLILSWDQAGLKALVVAFDPERSDFPLRPGFPVLLANALSWFFPSWLVVQADQVQAGSPRTLSVPVEGTVTVENPAGVKDVVSSSSSSVVYYDTRTAGFYRASAGNEMSEFAVSLASAQESDVTPRFTPGLPGAASEATPPAEAAVTVWAVVAAAALAFLLLEWFIWARAYREAR